MRLVPAAAVLLVTLGALVGLGLRRAASLALVPVRVRDHRRR